MLQILGDKRVALKKVFTANWALLHLSPKLERGKNSKMKNICK